MSKFFTRTQLQGMSTKKVCMLTSRGAVKILPVNGTDAAVKTKTNKKGEKEKELTMSPVTTYQKTPSAILAEVIPYMNGGKCKVAQGAGVAVSKASNRHKPAESEEECRKQCLREEGCKYAIFDDGFGQGT